VKVGASQKEQRLQRSGVCWFCGSSVKDGVGNETKLQKGGRWLEEAPDTGNTKSVKGDQLGVARKRLRSASGGSAVPVKAEHGEKLSSKSSRNEKGSNLVHPDKVQPEVSPTDLKKVRYSFTRFSNCFLCIVSGNLSLHAHYLTFLSYGPIKSSHYENLSSGIFSVRVDTYPV
jgi:hypothetical protein